MCSLGRLGLDSANSPQHAACMTRQPGRGMSMRYSFTRQPTFSNFTPLSLRGFPCTRIDGGKCREPL